VVSFRPVGAHFGAPPDCFLIRFAIDAPVLLTARTSFSLAVRARE
jgi:hypothetical protein